MAFGGKLGGLFVGCTLLALGCSSSTKSGTTGSVTTSGATGTATGTTGNAAGSTSGSASGSTSSSGGLLSCGTDLDCATAHDICTCGSVRGACADGGGLCAPTAETCQPRNLGTDCSRFGDCQDDFGDLLCYCRPDATVDAGGLCYLPQPACGTCTQDADCGNTPSLSPPGFCVALDGGSFCVAEDLSDCSGATVATPIDGGLIVCEPICDTCPCVGGCQTNADCLSPDAGVCSPSHFCVAPCAADGCADGQVCNVLDTYLDPGLTLIPALAQLYGGGQCGPACTTAASCAPYATDGGTPLACENDPTELNGNRCRPSGCLDSAECASTTPQPPYIPWCDVFNGNVCVATACRLGLATGSDCQAGDDCVADGGNPVGPTGAPATGECVVQPCTVAGALDTCAIDQLCCGEGDAGQSTCPTGTDLGACYAAPNPPWCATCDPSNGPFGIAACNRPANAVQFGTGLGTGFCGTTASGGSCEPACDHAIFSSCATGFQCADEVISVSACSQCGTNPCQDAGMGFLCGCVDDAGTGCPGQGTTPVACAGQGFCSYGSYCQATAHACQ